MLSEHPLKGPTFEGKETASKNPLDFSSQCFFFASSIQLTEGRNVNVLPEKNFLEQL